MKKLMLIFLMGMFLISFVSGLDTIGTFKKDTCIRLIQTCDNCSYVNISSVLYPNSSTAITNVAMTKDGTQYNYSFCNTSDIGQYIVNTFGDPDGVVTAASYTFDIKGMGIASSESTANAANRGVYALFIIAGLFFLAFLFTNKPVLKWTYFIVSILFITIGVNVLSISIFNEIGNTSIGVIFDQLGAACYYLYWFLSGILFFIWILSLMATLADKKNRRLAEQVGDTSAGRWG